MSSNENNTSSSSALAAASTKSANGRTTCAMKAKETAANSQRTDTTNIAPEGTTAAQTTKVDKEIDPTSHLSTEHLPSGAVLANSNGKPESKQAAIDSELEKRLKAEKLKPFLWATQVAPASKESMMIDFVAMGYSAAAAAKDLVKRKEPVKVDGTAQRPCAGFGRHVAGTGASPQKKKKKAASKKTAPPPPAPAPAPAPPALGRGAVRKVRKTSPAPEPPKAASTKKRKADEISADLDPQPAREPLAAAEESVVPGGEERQKKKRRPGRPKISAARVENSSSE
jgi:hypothetical protein